MHFKDRLKKPDFFLIIIASLLLVYQSMVMTNKIPPSTILGGEEEEEFPNFYKRKPMLECDQIIQQDIERGGRDKWSRSTVHIGMSHGIGSSITACEREAMLRQ